MTSGLRAVGVVALLGWAAAGCTAPRSVRLPDAFAATAEPLLVMRGGDTHACAVELGPYRASRCEHPVARPWRDPVFLGTYVGHQTRLSFDGPEGGHREVVCLKDVTVRTFLWFVPVGEAERKLACAVARPGDPREAPSGKLELAGTDTDAQRGGLATGTLTLDGVTLGVVPAEACEGGRCALEAGFELRQGERTVAVVDLTRRERVWLASGVDPAVREAAALGAAVLLLQPSWHALARGDNPATAAR